MVGFISGCVAQVVAENAELVKRNENKLINHGITGPEGFALSHTEEAEEEANLRACTMAHNMNCPLYLTHVSSMGTLDIIKTKKVSVRNMDSSLDAFFSIYLLDSLNFFLMVFNSFEKYYYYYLLSLISIKNLYCSY